MSATEPAPGAVDPRPAGTGRVEGLWLKRERRRPMVPVRRVRLEAGRGLAGNWNQGGPRQVTLIEREKWDDVEEELGVTGLDPGLRRANVLLRGIDLRDSEGQVLSLRGCRVRIGGETLPCGLMDRQHPGLREALKPDWRGGAYGVVLDDGEIEIGAPVAWAPEEVNATPAEAASGSGAAPASEKEETGR